MKDKVRGTKVKEFLTFGILTLAFFLSLPVSAGELKIGAAAVKITPPIGIPLAGQYFDRGAE